MKKFGMLAVCLMVAFVGCSKSSTSTTTTSAAPAMSASPAAPAMSSAVVHTATNASLGTILVNAAGRTLYHFDHDTTTTIACTGACTSTWPPLTVGASQTLPTSPTGLAKVTRPEGTKQVTYKGMPLYTYSGDTKAGDTKGDGFANLWHAAKVG